MLTDFWVVFGAKGPRVYHGNAKPDQVAEGDTLLLNPDLRAVEGVPLHHWKLVPGSGEFHIRPMNEHEKIAASAKALSSMEPVSITAVGRMATEQQKQNKEFECILSNHANHIKEHKDKHDILETKLDGVSSSVGVLFDHNSQKISDLRLKFYLAMLCLFLLNFSCFVFLFLLKRKLGG